MNRIALDFLIFAYEKGALKFGEYVLNSGRVSPYFMNTGVLSNGSDTSELGRFYANVISKEFNEGFMLYGPAYKGIPLVTATALALYQHHAVSVPFAFNRKEAKDHGDKGWTVGAELKNKVVIVEDVITSGLSIDGAVEIIRAHSAQPVAVIISLNRMEQAAADSDICAAAQIEQRHGIKVLSIATVYDLLAFVENSSELRIYLDSVRSYCDTYAAKSLV